MLIDGEDIRDSPFVVQIVESTALSQVYQLVNSEVSVEGVRQEEAEQLLLEQSPRLLARISCKKETRIERDALCIECYEASSGRAVGAWELEPESAGGARGGTPQVMARARPEAAGRHVLYVTYEYTNTGLDHQNAEGLGSPYRVRTSVFLCHSSTGGPMTNERKTGGGGNSRDCRVVSFFEKYLSFHKKTGGGRPPPPATYGRYAYASGSYLSLSHITPHSSCNCLRLNWLELITVK